MERFDLGECENGVEVGTPMDAGSSFCLQHRRDGVSGTDSGDVTVWNEKTRSHKKVTYSSWVRAVDVSLDGTRITTGSDDKTACVRSLSTGERMLDPLKHDSYVVGHPTDASLPPARRTTVRIYDSPCRCQLVAEPVARLDQR